MDLRLLLSCIWWEKPNKYDKASGEDYRFRKVKSSCKTKVVQTTKMDSSTVIDC